MERGFEESESAPRHLSREHGGWYHRERIMEKGGLKQMRSEGIEGIYCHPIGHKEHSAGTLIGMTNLQSGIPGLGDLPLLDEGYYNVDLYAESWIDELNEVVQFYPREDVYFHEETETWEWAWRQQVGILGR
jgi:hypothetical protein